MAQVKCLELRYDPRVGCARSAFFCSRSCRWDRSPSWIISSPYSWRPSDRLARSSYLRAVYPHWYADFYRDLGSVARVQLVHDATYYQAGGDFLSRLERSIRFDWRPAHRQRDASDSGVMTCLASLCRIEITHDLVVPCADLYWQTFHRRARKSRQCRDRISRDLCHPFRSSYGSSYGRRIPSEGSGRVALPNSQLTKRKGRLELPLRDYA